MTLTPAALGKPDLVMEATEDGEGFDRGTLTAGWSIAWGCRLNFGWHDGELRALVSVSDRVQADGVAARAVTPDQLRAFAAQLIAVADVHEGAAVSGE